MSADPVTVGNPAGIVYAAFSLLSPGQSRAERKDKRAAERAGYDVAVRAKGVAIYTDPAGNRITREQFYRAGRELRTGADSAVVVGPPPVITPTRPPYQSPIGTPRGTPPIMPRGGTAPPYRSPINADELRRYVEEQARRRAAQANRAPVFRRPPRIDPNATVVREGLKRAAVLARIGSILAGVLYPSSTARDDTVPGPMPGDSRGPTRRPRIRPGQRPDIVSAPAPGTPPRSSSPSPEQVRPPQDRPVPVLTSPQPTGPVFDPKTIPAPSTPTIPRSFPWKDVLQYAVPFVLPLAAPLFQGAPSTQPATAPSGNAPPRIPLTTFQPTPLQSVPETDPCKRASDRERNRRRKGDKCVNRITNKRTFRRGGSKYRTITRKLEC